MKSFLKSLALSAGLLLSLHGYAQTAATMVANPMASGTASGAPAAMPGPALAAAKSAPAPGGKVWVNSTSRVYHCAGSKYYGKTKAGQYMSEADAKAGGNRPNNKKTCS